MANEALRKLQEGILNVRNLFLFPAWVLSLVVFFSVPATKTIYLWDFVIAGKAKFVGVSAGQIDSGFRFGLFGYCFDGIDVKVLGAGGDALRGSCVKTSIGIHIQPAVAEALGLQKLENDFNGTFRAVIAFHIIVFVAATLALIVNILPRGKTSNAHPSLKNPASTLKYAKRSMFPLVAIIAVTALISFIVDIAVAKIAGAIVKNIDSPIGDVDFTPRVGPIVWLMLTVFLLLLLLAFNEKTDFIGKRIPVLSLRKQPAADRQVLMAEAGNSHRSYDNPYVNSNIPGQRNPTDGTREIPLTPKPAPDPVH